MIFFFVLIGCCDNFGFVLTTLDRKALQCCCALFQVLINMSLLFFLECGRGKSYRSRLLFIDICKFIMELFSRRFFKENFFEFLLELGSVSIYYFSVAL